MPVDFAVCRVTGNLDFGSVFLYYSIAKHNLELRYFIIPTGSTFIFKFAFVLPHSLTCISLIYSFRSLCYDRSIASSQGAI